MSLVAKTLGSALDGVRPPYRPHPDARAVRKADDANLLPRIRQIAAQRPPTATAASRRSSIDSKRAEGWRRSITSASTASWPQIACCWRGATPSRADYGHDGVVGAIRSNLRWCSDGFEFTCWNGEVVRGAFIIDAHDREIIAWRAVANAGISGSDVRDIMLEAEETLRRMRAPVPVEMLSDKRLGLYRSRKHANLCQANWASNPASRPSAARSPTASRRPSFIRSSAITSASHRCPMLPNAL